MIKTRRDKIRTAFLIFFLYLLFQYGLVGFIGHIYSEPWPTFTLPGFKNVYDRGDYIEQRVARFTAFSEKDTVYTLRPADVFRDIPVSHHNGIMRYQFNPERIPGSDKIRELNPGGYDWLHQRIKEETGDMTVDRITVIWFWHRYQIRGEEMRALSEVPYDTLHITKRPVQ